MAPRKERLTREEILAKKREAEKKRYNEMKTDPEKWKQQQEKERLKYLKKKEKGQRKAVKDMTPREKRAKRKYWVEMQASCRERKRLRTAAATAVNEVPNGEIITQANRRPERQPERRRCRDRELRKRNKEIKKLNVKCEKYKKRYARLKQKITSLKSKDSPSPKTKIMQLENSPIPTKRAELVKKAIFGEIIEKQLTENYSKLKSYSEKRVFDKVVGGRIVKKYKVWKLTKNKSLTYKRLSASENITFIQSQKLKHRNRLIQKVKQFYRDDGNSRLCAGKKEFVTKKKVKKQKRYLLDSMKNLHRKFLTENPNMTISYSLFCRLRPFFVIPPKVTDRETCLCVLHANIDLLISALKNANILSLNGFQDWLQTCCCDRFIEKCLERRCDSCKNKVVKYRTFDNNKPITFLQWMNCKEKYEDPKTKKQKIVVKYKKQQFNLPPREVILKLEADVLKLYSHERNIVHQYTAFKKLKENLGPKDTIIHMDFSENFLTKYNTEVQSFHFGGSRSQISLHTVVVYLKNETKCFCTVSSNLSHGPGAIFEHLIPILKTLPDEIENLHFYSDGPVTQYRNKSIFYILACELNKFCPNIVRFTWNYHEAGHGKGAPDGIGAVCKRSADNVVATGGDITNVADFAAAVQERCPKVKIFIIDPNDIEKSNNSILQIQPKTVSFKGTLQVHQVTGNIFIPKMLTMKSLSCFCNPDGCDHYKLGTLIYEKNRLWDVDDIFPDSEVQNGISDLETANVQKLANKENEFDENNINDVSYKSGDYFLIRFSSTKTEYRYAAICSDVEEKEKELKVTFLKSCGDGGTLFRLDEKDTAYVKFEEIIEKLPVPIIQVKGERVFYKFKSNINVNEK